MSATLPILTSIRDELLAKTKAYTIELFPDDPSSYYLRDQDGAILVQYAGSTFLPTGSVDMIQQCREVLVALTLIARSQHDDSGALAMLDEVRLIMTGFRPTNCEPMSLVREEYVGEYDGLWQYHLMVKTQTWQVQNSVPEKLPHLVQLYQRHHNEPLNPALTQKKLTNN